MAAPSDPTGPTHANAAPMFARSGTTAELRGECPRDVLNVLDAVSMVRDITRTALVNEILGHWAAAKHRESIMVQKIAGTNPIGSEGAGT